MISLLVLDYYIQDENIKQAKQDAHGTSILSHFCPYFLGLCPWATNDRLNRTSVVESHAPLGRYAAAASSRAASSARSFELADHPTGGRCAIASETEMHRATAL